MKGKKKNISKTSTDKAAKKPVTREKTASVKKTTATKKPGAIVKKRAKATTRKKASPKKVEKTFAITPYDAMGQYLVSIKKYSLLTREEEHKVAVRFHEDGDLDAAKTLVTANLRFVVKIAQEYSKFGAKLIDLVQEGNIGLMKAVKDFNPYKDVRLISYAVWWIRGYIQDYLLKNYSMVKMGTTSAQKKLFYKLKKAQEEIEGMGFSPEVKLLAAHLGVREKDVSQMQTRLDGKDVSLDAKLTDNSDDRFLNIFADNAESQETTLIAAEQKAIFHDELPVFGKTLSEREQYILSDRLLSETPLSLKEIGITLNITKERVRQIEERIKKKMKEHFQGKL